MRVLKNDRKDVSEWQKGMKVDASFVQKPTSSLSGNFPSISGSSLSSPSSCFFVPKRFHFEMGASEMNSPSMTGWKGQVIAAAFSSHTFSAAWRSRARGTSVRRWRRMELGDEEASEDGDGDRCERKEASWDWGSGEAGEWIERDVGEADSRMAEAKSGGEGDVSW